jgi:hypothetical protein
MSETQIEVTEDTKAYIGHLHRRSVADVLEIERLRARILELEAALAIALRRT